MKRTHGLVWHALVETLKARNIKTTNVRVGRWGPDLWTTEGVRVLFEIEVTVSAHDIQRAVGQLMLYEVLLKKKHRKVLVVPEPVGFKARKALRQVGVAVLSFQNSGSTIKFDQSRLDTIFAA